MLKIKKIISILLITILSFLILNFNKVYAAASVSLTENKTIEVGDTVIITASYTAGGWNLVLSGNGVTEKMVGETNIEGNTSGSKSITFTPTSKGKYEFTLIGDITDFYSVDYQPIYIGKNCIITVNEKTVQSENNNNDNNNNNNNEGQTPSQGTNTNNIPQDAPKQTETKSRNYYLSSLSVSTKNGEIKLGQVGNESAGFNREVENYVVVFPDNFNYDNFEKISISATAEDSKAKISGTGEVTINEGDNNFEIRCTAENGSVKTYKIKVTKPIVIKESELKLDSLIIEKINENGESEVVVLDKEFDPTTLSYNCDVESKFESLSIKTAVSKVKNKDIIVKINGKEINRDLEGNLEEEQIKLEDGANTIRITLVSPIDESVSTDYVINAKREVVVETVAQVSENKEFFTKENLPKIIIGVILGIILILIITLIILIIINKKQQAKAKILAEDNKDGEKLFNYDEEDTYLNDKSLEKLNEEYEKKINKSSNKRSVKNSKTTTNSEVKSTNKEKSKSSTKDEKENEIKEKEEKYENLTNEMRQQRLDELIKELKSKNKKKN